ncbi:zymogen granule membrane protein 16-like [Chanos chanos]|uniref:Zymogen granule membrane protein 16-like n=1 Tax=Chanos chanos TaxID=29144 RepID=A0A6J2WM63_CHACN|nr:zymogen granule membrane protein 16-like [Chanos chanos]
MRNQKCFNIPEHVSQGDKAMGPSFHRMLFVAIFALFFACACAGPIGDSYSYSPAVGSGSGTPYTITGQGRITAVRLWENYNGHIRGIQLRYDYAWSLVAGYVSGEELLMELFDGEFIVQISGKYSHYIQNLQIVTNRGRFLQAGQPYGTSFNLYPTNSQSELRILSGRYHGGLTSIGAHWAIRYNTTMP